MTNDIPPQVTKEQGERNREIRTRQHFFGLSLHSALWTPENLTRDQSLEEAMNRRSNLVPAPKPAPFVHTGFELGAL